MFKKDFFKTFGLTAALAPFAIGSVAKAAAAGDGDRDELTGLWETTVKGSAGSYRYIYAISRGSYVATGDIDENYQGTKYSPTMGAYRREADGAFAYRERGYAFDLKGAKVGTFESTGRMRLSTDGDAFSGPGTFTQYDLHLKAVFTEPFTLTAARVKI